MSTPNWQSALEQSYEQLIAYLLTYTPNLFGAVILLFIGWVVAWSLSRLTQTLLKLSSRLVSRFSSSLFSEKISEIKPSHALIVSRTIFWLVMLFFVAAATSNLGLDFFATWISQLLAYVPRLLAGIVIIFGGYLLGSVISVMAQAAAETAGFKRSQLIANVSKLAVIFTAMVVGIEQLGINLQFVTNLVIVVSGVMVFGVSLAFGLGSKDLVANILGARQCKAHFRVNERVRMGDTEGTLIQVTATMIVLETDEGRAILPARHCMESITHVDLGKQEGQ
ncbi:mechanosensitive ion channel [Aestuariibacter sp. AA17]|uniref:Small-conductance mechanosensitive channel n=1 Tax=Fluctibacter corallii TaxID=2984329 RepID=A0ABT3AD61_9ALTE|nr:mechanosensitive ion channel domain-containing protein [Aestuariibacter sp. AA17]MCV2886611.1 mechanosensitive ion channel [Aestuariibacter sp. AA17]